MITRFVFTVSPNDPFRVAKGVKVNINDSSQMLYTFWHPLNGRKQTYITPRQFKSEALDLLYISMMVFYADRKVKRSKQDDAWTRSFDLYIPVMSYDKWEACKDTLVKALNFLTGDHWRLNFRRRVPLIDHEDHYRKCRYLYRNSTRRIDSDTFCMLSGGLDSFIGAINLLTEHKNPIFVGNYNGGKGVKIYQDKVVEALSTKFNVEANRFFRYYAAPKSGKEDTTRSRSLLFFSQAIVIASGMGYHINLYIPENGVISLNIPLTVMRIGSLSTRTTHPYFIRLLQNIINMLGLDISLINPFQFMTKGEMMINCKDKDFLNSHYQLTMSCSHPDQGRWSGETTGHCGECLPCTIRKAAIMAAGLEDATYYRHSYDTPNGVLALKSYKQGLAMPKEPYAAIQMNGPINDSMQAFANLYERGIKELKNYLDTI